MQKLKDHYKPRVSFPSYLRKPIKQQARAYGVSPAVALAMIVEDWLKQSK